MKSYQMFLVFMLVGSTISIDVCKSFQSYSTCIQSDIEKCMWDNVRNLCYQTNDYLSGCSLMLNKPACLRQIGNVFGELSKCRFTDVCEDIPDLTTEYCTSNLSKSGCLSIQNPNQVCKWVNDACEGVNEALWTQIQDDFDTVLYSASACSHIENYLVMHHTLLWPLLDYSPDLVTEADNIYKQELGIEVTVTENYDDPSTVTMQNNYVQQDGTFAWYTIRVSKSITLTNLRKTSRTREGCIALEIGSDSDFTAILSLTGQVKGVNHVYCKYLNNNPSITDTYLYSNGGCQIFEQSKLNDQSLIAQLNCYSLNLIQCIYFDSIAQSCQIRSDAYEYPCIPLKEGNEIDCTTQLCTAQQCRQMDYYYIEETNNNCENSCLTYYDSSCPSTCTFLGTTNVNDVIQHVCGPLNVCDEVGMSQQGCQLLKAKCSWSDSLNRCFTLNDKDIKLMKCAEAKNIYVCTLITLSDQLCYWNSNQCLNVLDEPLLITHFIFINDSSVDNTICNMNLCKHNDRIPTEYDNQTRVCKFQTSTFTDDKALMNKYRCIKYMAGYCLWDNTQQICVCLTAAELSLKQCSTLQNVNEKLCQKAKVSDATKICIYDSGTYSCLEQTQAYVNQLMCAGYGLSEAQCVLKNNNGEFCQYSAGLCQQITESNINSIRCTSLQQVNQQVCKIQSIYNVMCVYDSVTNSCYSPSLYNVINFNQYINRYACQAVTGSNTFFDTTLNFCKSFTTNTDPMLNILTCEGYFVNKSTCVIISTPGQYCYWDTTLNICRNYSGTFNNCDEYKKAPPKVCTALQTTLSIQFMSQDYCSYDTVNEVCTTSASVILDCGSSEQMNIHRCSGMTGLDTSNTPTNMCAFVNHKCVALTSDTMDAYILLENINCIQSNLKTCLNILTPGQFCYVTNNVSSTILDRKCQVTTILTDSCTTVNSSFAVSLINPNHCARAVDACSYTATGCVVPTSTTLPCSTQGLSKKACVFYTQNYRCAFLNNMCQFIPFYAVITDCSVLNQVACSSNNHYNCIWKDTSTGCISNVGLTPHVSEFTCTKDTSSNFLVSNGSTCITIDPQNYGNYSCDYYGLNEYGCHRIPNQFCDFHNNRCSFHADILCEDTLATCSSNQSNYNCVLKDSKCFNLSNTNYLCDLFDQTNYSFCQQYPDCVYQAKKCHQRNQQTVYSQCESLDQLSCTIQNKQLSCKFDTSCTSYTIENTQCPSLTGYFSYEVCNKHSNCQYGYTKNGFGFCYLGASFSTLTCEMLSKTMCLDDLIHLNSNLTCYWDQTCKTINNFSCADLLPFQTNIGGCNKVSSGDCKFSHVDHLCKPIHEYTGTVCQGTTALQCNRVQNTCYFDGTTCQSSGTALNKYGCLMQSGKWRFIYQACGQVADSQVLISNCFNKSKDLCLSDKTSQLHCRWHNYNCYPVLEFEIKQITSCQNLNERVCKGVRLSNVQCSWDSTNKVCNSITIASTDCSLSGQSNTSASLCGSQQGANCARYSDGTKCTQITVQLSDCNKYGLNQQACLTLTTVPCQWIMIGSGGYCENANLYQANCADQLNQYACNQVKSPGQYCLWNNGACTQQTITGCNSASGLNGQISCNAVTQEACEYDSLTNQCTQVLSSPLLCSDRYNLLACKMSIASCSWNNNICVSDDQVFECQKLLNRNLCLTNSELGCKWTGTACADYRSLDVKIFCKDLPTNINDFACQFNAIDPCFYDTTVQHCLPAQKNDGSYLTLPELLVLQTASYQSQLLIASCEQLTTQAACIASRKPGQACKWNGNCQTILDFSQIQCSESLNIYGCLSITTSNQLCQWTTQCVLWDNVTLTNININVCISNSINSVYIDYSCQTLDLSIIDCNSPGLSMITCLSLSKQQCQWNGNQCQIFVHSNQSKCSDFTQISPYVCQMQKLSACNYDSINHCCIDAPLDSIGTGTSILACLSNSEQLTYWNVDECDILSDSIKCDSPLQVNALACATISKKSCVYNKVTQTCTSSYNPNSLRCSTPGLNYYACLNVTTEPCIFLQGACSKFVDTSATCMTLTNVNAKTCASLVDQDCLYDEINFRCQTPLLAIEKCSTEGVNQDVCENNTLCKFSKDHLDCLCSSLQQKDQCQIDDVKDCKSNPNCYFEGTACVRKQCYHLTSQECTGKVIDNKTCYISVSNGCQPASQCEDIVDPRDQCQTLLIDSIPCLQAATQCVTATNYELYCPFSDCLNTNCFYELGVCRKKRCSDYPINECVSHGGCYITATNECQDLSNCSLVDAETYGEHQVLNICNQLSVNGFKCNYQRFALLDDTLICTNQPCEMYGSSSTLCQGNENNGYSCFLSSKLVCQQCETIVEPCYCNKQANVCSYSNGKCQSLLCSSFLTKEICSQAEGRCYWSTQLSSNNNTIEGCTKECVKITDSDECNSRTGECYYEYLVSQCKKGQKVVPSLTLDITIEQFYGLILQISLILYGFL